MVEESRANAQAEAQSQANPYRDEKKIYEIGYHVVSTTPEEQVGKVVERVRAAVERAGGEVVREGFPRKMTLAYTIERPVSGGRREKHAEAYFGWILFEAEPGKISALQDTLRGVREILRFLLIETVREDITVQPRRAVFESRSLEGKTIEHRRAAPEDKSEVSEEELDKSIEALVS